MVQLNPLADNAPAAQRLDGPTRTAMVQLTLFPDDAPGPRWISPPWTTASDRWLEIDRA